MQLQPRHTICVRGVRPTQSGSPAQHRRTPQDSSLSRLLTAGYTSASYTRSTVFSSKRFFRRLFITASTLHSPRRETSRCPGSRAAGTGARPSSERRMERAGPDACVGLLGELDPVQLGAAWREPRTAERG